MTLGRDIVSELDLEAEDVKHMTIESLDRPLDSADYVYGAYTDYVQSPSPVFSDEYAEGTDAACANDIT